MHPRHRCRISLRRGLLALIIALSVTVGLEAPARADHPEWVDYERLEQIVSQWQQRGVDVEVPAYSGEGRKLFLVRLGTGPVTILYSNALHANEPAAVEAFVRFVWLLLADAEPTFTADVLPGVSRQAPLFKALANPAVRRELLKRVTIVGFPMLDPDGIENGHRRDPLTNLDYTTKITPQSAALDYAVHAYQPDVFLDSHGGPPTPELNIGLAEPLYADPAVLAESRRAAATAWRAADALGVRLAYFEEWPLQMSFGLHNEPFSSIDQAYYSAVTKAVPALQEYYQLDGLPTVYTETVGLQLPDQNDISISEGASAQQVTMAGLALEMSGLLTSERTTKVLAAPTADGLPITIDDHARRLYAVVHWRRGVTGTAAGQLQDYELILRSASGDEIARSAPPQVDGMSASRAIALPAVPPGNYRLFAQPRLPNVDDGAVIRALWRTPDTHGPRLHGVLGPEENVSLCLRGDTLYQDLTGASSATRPLGSPRCGN